LHAPPASPAARFLLPALAIFTASEKISARTKNFSLPAVALTRRIRAIQIRKAAGRANCFTPRA
jgi:hypothetical protein